MEIRGDESLGKEKPACGYCCIRVEGMSVIQGNKEIISGVDLHLHCGELLAIIGPNGAGKSTVLKALIGEIPYQGKITYMNADGTRKGKPRIGYMPQRWDFDPGSPITVSDLFSVVLGRTPVWLVNPRNLREMILTALTRVEGEHLIDRRMGELSGGEVQRVLLALAMEPVPDLLLLDEPVSGIDYNGRKLFYRIVSHLRKKYDLSIIMVSHDLDLMKQFADQVVFINKSVLCTGTPEQVMKNPRIMDTFGLISEEMPTMRTACHRTEEGGDTDGNLV